jgi:cyclophilin family peptidyl-prolyl cis-trans isomerase
MKISRRFASAIVVAAMAGALCSSLTGAASAADTPAPAPSGSSAPPQVRVTTNMGNFVIELNPERAPLTVATFLRYVKEGQYTQTLLHRVIAGFLVQGGGYSAVDESLKPTHGAIPNESGNGLQNKRGTVGLARTIMPHSGNCQFYVNLADNPELDPLPVRWGYAVFGRVIDGMDVVDRISTVPTGAAAKFPADAPLKPVVIEKIELLGPGGVKQDTPNQLAPAPTGNDVLSPN